MPPAPVYWGPARVTVVQLVSAAAEVMPTEALPAA
jgi:hypothetical protein